MKDLTGFDELSPGEGTFNLDQRDVELIFGSPMEMP